MTADECLKPTAHKAKPSTGNVYQFIPRTKLSALPAKGTVPSTISPGNSQLPEDDDDPPAA
jgi:hypothetical protein